MIAPFRTPVSLENATRLSGENGEYSIELKDDWQLWGPSGGYLCAIALRAAAGISNQPRPLSIYAHFVRAPKFGPVEIEATALQAGRRAESLRVEMRQEGKLVFTALVRTAAEQSGVSHLAIDRPDVPAPAEVADFRWTGPRSDEYTYWNNFDRRPVTPWADEPSTPFVHEWIKLSADPVPSDPFLSAALAILHIDTFGWLAAVRPYPDGGFIAPNLDTSAWFHDLGAVTEWLLVDHTSPVATDGVIAVDGKLWSEDGALVASGAAHLMQIDLG